MNELTIAVSGWVATDPTLRIGAGGTTMTTFRIASTARYFDRDRKQWVDSKTEWFNVRVFRGNAITVEKSLFKGQPVVVTGRLRTNVWESQSGPRTDLVIDAHAVGHDLTKGIATFTRATGDATLDAEPATPGAPADADGAADEGAASVRSVDEAPTDALEVPDGEQQDDGYADLDLEDEQTGDAVEDDDLEPAAAR
ncbi:single-stranded DNA-binding protein [Demequina sp. NBRC 110052]|uniref:single-stranded DNA-binding protein n=1 Tax=Demequina sp. NBRC 110052 TaxID=1570341 RepID=UPI000A00D6DB|nr:single-stranded DNA-binding protein [Demequina sp. NBRC 110052]